MSKDFLMKHQLRYLPIPFLVFALAALHAAESLPTAEKDEKPVIRASKPTDGGLTLFSWQEKGKDDWHFVLMPAPNVEKLKSAAEVAASPDAFVGLDALKKKFSALAINEKVGWFNMLEKRGPAPENLIFDFPPRDTIKDLELFCSVLKVRLNIYLRK